MANPNSETSSETDSSLFESVNLERSIGNEITFSDWQFIDESIDHGSSDDDSSIEIIEREILCSTPASDIDDADDECGNEIIIDHERENIETTTDHVQLSEMIASSIDLQPDEPVEMCYSCTSEVAESVDISDIGDTTNSITWKIVYSFTLGVLASLIIHQYKGYIPDKWPSFHFSGEYQYTDLLNILPFSFPPSSSNSSNNSTFEIPNGAAEDSNNILTQLRNYIETQKTSVNDVFTEQLNFLKNARLVKDDIYAFHISKLTQQEQFQQVMSNHFSGLVKDVKEIPICPSNITSEQLPMVCKDNQDAVILVEKTQLILVQRNIKEFFVASEDKLKRLHISVMSTLTEPTSSYDTSVKDTNNFVPDCDNFSKQYKSTTYCSKTNTQCGGAESNVDERINKTPQNLAPIHETVEKSKTSDKLRGNKFSWSKFAGKALPKEGTKNNEKLSRELKVLITKLKQIFKNFYRVYISLDDVELKGFKNVNTSGVAERTDRNFATEDEENKKPVSGKWFFDLYEARAKLRYYYKNAVNGEWILKMGKAREKWRSRDNEKEEGKKKGGHNKESNPKNWFKKAPEKLKSSFKKISSTWKIQLKKMKETLVSNYKKWQVNIENMFHE